MNMLTQVKNKRIFPVIILAIIKFSACRPENLSTIDKVVKPKEKRTVLVVDNHFELENPALRDKVIASYTLDCQIDKSLRLLPVSRPYLNVCTLVEGISDATVTKDHGTPVASIIGHQNNNVEFILLKEKLRVPEPDKPVEPTSNESNTLAEPADSSDVCNQVASEFQRQLKPKNWKSMINRSIQNFKKSSYGQIRNIIEKHDVDLVNLSSSPAEWDAILQLFLAQPCGGKYGPDLVSAMKKIHMYILDELKESLALDHTSIFQSAGNDGFVMDGPDDHGICSNEHIKVGSVDRRGKISGFSNSGDCVDYYAMGDDINVLKGKKGIVTPTFGTSYATPLIVRQLTKFEGPFDLKSVRGYLGQNKFLKIRPPIEGKTPRKASRSSELDDSRP